MGAAVRNHRNAVRDGSESLSAINRNPCPQSPESALIIQLGEIPDEARQLERHLWPAFEAAAPRLLGALLTAASAGLEALPSVDLKQLPRMADFAEWAVACERSLWKPGTFMDAYMANRQGAIVDLVEGNLLASTVSAFIEEEKEWTGTATDLLEELDEKVTETQRKSKAWPKAANALSGKLTRLTGDLRKVGIEIIQAGRDKNTNKKFLEVRKRSLGSLSSLNANNSNGLDRNDLESKIVNDNGLDNDLEAGSLSPNHLKRQPNNDDNDPNDLFRTPRKPRFRNSDERFIYRNGKRYTGKEN